VEKESGIPTISAAVCTAHQMMKSIGLEPRSSVGGLLMSGRGAISQDDAFVEART
jgi:maleate isomerase